jgi:hypothetical protein
MTSNNNIIGYSKIMGIYVSSTVTENLAFVLLETLLFFCWDRFSHFFHFEYLSCFLTFTLSTKQ